MCGEERESVGVGLDRADEFVVFLVVVAGLEVVSAHDADFAEVGVLFPLCEVGFSINVSVRIGKR